MSYKKYLKVGEPLSRYVSDRLRGIDKDEASSETEELSSSESGTDAIYFDEVNASYGLHGDKYEMDEGVD